jgi:FAD/FMN-containing dehydrogenase
VAETEALVIATSRMRRVLAVDLENRRITVQPGVINSWVTRAVAGDGFYYAPDPSSQVACSIGGNIAENSGGVHCLKYGVTSNHVLAMEVVLPDGSVMTLGGELDEAPELDLRGAFIGSEGTLGIATAITLRLLRTPQSVAVLLAVIGAFENDFHRAGGEAGRFEQSAERHAAPLGVADRAGAPLHALGAFAQERTPVAGAFDGREHGVLGQRGELGERPSGGAGDQAVQRAGPRGGVGGDGRLKVVPHEKEPVRGDPPGGVVEGSFAVLRGRRDDFSLGIHRRDAAEPCWTIHTARSRGNGQGGKRRGVGKRRVSVSPFSNRRSGPR